MAFHLFKRQSRGFYGFYQFLKTSIRLGWHLQKTPRVDAVSSYVLLWFPRSTHHLYYPGASVPVKRLPLPRDSRLHSVLYPDLIPFPTDALSLPGSSPQSRTAFGCPVSLNSSGLFLRPSLVFVTLTVGRPAGQIFYLCIFQLSVSI